LVWYASKEEGFKWFKLTLKQVQEVIAMNKNGEKSPSLEDLESETMVATKIDFENVVGQDSLTRFDKPKTKNKRRDKKKKSAQAKGQQNPNALRKQGPRKPRNNQQKKEANQKGTEANKNPNQKPKNSNVNGPKQGAPKKRRPQNRNKQNPATTANAPKSGVALNDQKQTAARADGTGSKPKRNNNRRRKPNNNNKPDTNANKDR